MLLHLPPNLYSALETIVFTKNERLQALGRSNDWEPATIEDLIRDAAADYIRKHIQIDNVPSTPKQHHGAGRVQRRS